MTRVGSVDSTPFCGYNLFFHSFSLFSPFSRGWVDRGTVVCVLSNFFLLSYIKEYIYYGN
jgi:hypothetical protein